jgi:hypothetical protein
VNIEWDANKAAINARKHGITFHEVATAFGDPLAMTFVDPDHSVNAALRSLIGISKAQVERAA